VGTEVDIGVDWGLSSFSYFPIFVHQELTYCYSSCCCSYARSLFYL